MEESYIVLEALANSINAILNAISQFDILAVDTQKLAGVAQVIADAVRIILPAAKLVGGLISKAF